MTILNERGQPVRFDPLTGETARVEGPPDFGGCDHGVAYDEDAARGLDEYDVRRRWPRLHGTCPMGCGFVGIAYASAMHYIMGDW